jgi:decaprenylphospho-beta-D-ribofuranose 2-oxidase
LAERRQTFAGWGGTQPSIARAASASSTDAIADVLRRADQRGVLSRGLGRAYGDAAQNAGGIVLSLRDGAPAVQLDAARGEVTVWAGVSMDRVMREIVPRGWFVPVSAGTRHITVGGALAADIHGKNHHGAGSFASHVTSFTLVGPDGQPRVVSPDADASLFWATAGGMGLTGVIAECTFRAFPIETSRILVDAERAKDLDDVLARMTEGDHRYRYSVAWIDLVAGNRRLGRSVLTRGDHAPLAALSGKARRDPLAFAPRALASVPPIVPSGLLNHATVRAFNEFWYRKAPRRRVGHLMTIGGYFHPLDAVHHWNRLYGRGGFVQYQFVVPFGAEPTLRRVVEEMVRFGVPSFLAVLKRFGGSNPGPLSFPMPGWTLALDIPARLDGLGPLLRRLDEQVLAAGGRHYLAKDAHIGPDQVKAGYPRLAEWLAIRDRVDPDGLWQSDLGRRLGLCGPRSA